MRPNVSEQVRMDPNTSKHVWKLWKTCENFEQLREIAETKLADLNAGGVEEAMQIIAGTARSMGVLTEGIWLNKVNDKKLFKIK